MSWSKLVVSCPSEGHKNKRIDLTVSPHKYLAGDNHKHKLICQEAFCNFNLYHAKITKDHALIDTVTHTGTLNIPLTLRYYSSRSLCYYGLAKAIISYPQTKRRGCGEMKLNKLTQKYIATWFGKRKFHTCKVITSPTFMTNVLRDFVGTDPTSSFFTSMYVNKTDWIPSAPEVQLVSLPVENEKWFNHG